MIRPIAPGLSPNTEHDDVLLALQLLLHPTTWQEGNYTKQLEAWFVSFFGVKEAVSFNSGRVALYAVLKAAGVGEGSEVITQSFTCVAIANAILALSAKPVFVDISENLTIDPVSVEKNITKRTKAIIVQHTFGIPADLDALKVIAEKHNLFLIEDSAHTIGGMYKGLSAARLPAGQGREGKKLGSLSDAAIFSFGRDKAFSSVFGGMAVAKNEVFAKKLRAFQETLSYPSAYWTAQQLLHPVAFSIILPLYNVFGIGKFLLAILQKLRLLSFPVSDAEKRGEKNALFVRRMPNALSQLAMFQIRKLARYNEKRSEFVEMYIEKLKHLPLSMPFTEKTPLLRFPILVEHPSELLWFFKKHGIYLGKWYACVIDPKGVSLDAISYKEGLCKNAEHAAKYVVNLPTYPTMKKSDAEKIIQMMEEFFHA